MEGKDHNGRVIHLEDYHEERDVHRSSLRMRVKKHNLFLSLPIDFYLVQR